MRLQGMEFRYGVQPLGCPWESDCSDASGRIKPELHRLHVRSSGMEFRPLGCPSESDYSDASGRLKPELHARFGYGVRSSGRRRGRLKPELRTLRYCVIGTWLLRI